MKLNIKDTFNQELPADKITSNTRRQVREACYSYVSPRTPSQPELVHVSPEMGKAIGLSSADWESDEFLNIFTGAKVLDDSSPYAMCYGGHQFGNWAGQLGDGRAINLAEVAHADKRWVLQLKGAGETPYSRTADGLAVLRSSIREHLCSEAMYHLGVPTTRSLSLSLSGDKVLRDVMYDGHAAYEKGAIVCRTAPSFVRFGNFQIFTSRGDLKTLGKLTDYTNRQFFPEIQGDRKQTVPAFFRAVAERTMEMILHWQRVGFVHGVMNTDNMSILGLTIDYGPYGWLEGYEKDWTPNTTDSQNRRYRYGNQPLVAIWNLYQLANALVPLVNDPAPFEQVLHSLDESYQAAALEMHRSKLGLQEQDDGDVALIDSLEGILEMTETDMTIFYRLLANASREDHPDDLLQRVREAFYQPDELSGAVLDSWNNWSANYLNRLQKEKHPDEDRKARMNQVNPKYVLRNYMAQVAIDAADNGDYSVVAELYEMLRKPYAEQARYEKWFARRPEWARHRVGCSMLSCSS